MVLIKVPKYGILGVAFEEYFNGLRGSDVLVMTLVFVWMLQMIVTYICI